MESGGPQRLSIIVEWENTRRAEQDRAGGLLQALRHQWQSLHGEVSQGILPTQVSSFLARFSRKCQLLVVYDENTARAKDVVSGVRAELDSAADQFSLATVAGHDVGYWSQKNLGAARADGDIILFVDSDVLPEDGWLVRLLGSFSDPEVQVVGGNTFVPAVGTVDKAFALGWIFPLRESGQTLIEAPYFFGNNVAFRTPVARTFPFSVDGFTRAGGCPELHKRLAANGIQVYLQQAARVSHPRPQGVLMQWTRAIAHGRDIYYRNFVPKNPLRTAFKVALRKATAAFKNILRRGGEVDLKPHELPIVLGIIGAFYFFWLVGVVVTHLRPQVTVLPPFRV